MKTKTIIKGYNGIMDLDLTNIPSSSHKEMIDIHQRDIQTYKKEQSERPPHLRYENAILSAYRRIEKMKDAQTRANIQYIEKQNTRYSEHTKHMK